VTSGINAGNDDVQPMDDIIDPPDPGSDMVVDPEGLSESSFIP
jgi:hypothetical protein